MQDPTLYACHSIYRLLLLFILKFLTSFDVKWIFSSRNICSQYCAVCLRDYCTYMYIFRCSSVHGVVESEGTTAGGLVFANRVYTFHKYLPKVFPNDARIPLYPPTSYPSPHFLSVDSTHLKINSTSSNVYAVCYNIYLINVVFLFNSHLRIIKKKKKYQKVPSHCPTRMILKGLLQKFSYMTIIFCHFPLRYS